MKILDIINRGLAWVGADGIFHFLISALDVLIFATFVPLWVAVLIVLGIGILKEAWDLAKRKSAYDWKDGWSDMMCDVLGIALGTGIASLYLFVV